MKSFVICGVIMSVVISCTHDPVLPDSPKISFKAQVQPIIVANCATVGCHDGSHEFRLSTYNDVMRVVETGHANKSKLFSVITKLSGEEAMPPTGPLTNDQIRLIYVWIEQGANNN